MRMAFRCDHCGSQSTQERGALNRARRKGLKVYCNWVCSGLGRRSGKSKDQRIAEKADYDRRRRADLGETLLAKKRAAFKRDYDPDKARIYRKSRMPYHVKYCRRPAYRAKKKDYDLRHSANQSFGEFAEAALMLRDIENEIAARASNYEIRVANDTINKTQKRKRQHAQSQTSYHSSESTTRGIGLIRN